MDDSLTIEKLNEASAALKAWMSRKAEEASREESWAQRDPAAKDLMKRKGPLRYAPVGGLQESDPSVWRKMSLRERGIFKAVQDGIFGWLAQNAPEIEAIRSSLSLSVVELPERMVVLIAVVWRGFVVEQRVRMDVLLGGNASAIWNISEEYGRRLASMLVDRARRQMLEACGLQFVPLEEAGARPGLRPAPPAAVVPAVRKLRVGED